MGARGHSGADREVERSCRCAGPLERSGGGGGDLGPGRGEYAGEGVGEGGGAGRRWAMMRRKSSQPVQPVVPSRESPKKKNKRTKE